MAENIHHLLDISVYATVRKETEVCDLGEEHKVNIMIRKVLGPVIGKREYDNGYEKRDTDLRQDRQGRTYHQHIQIDYFNNVSWKRDEDGLLLMHRLPSGPCREYLTGKRLR